MKRSILTILLVAMGLWVHVFAQPTSGLTIVNTFSEVGKGWSQNSVNATIFRKNSVVSSTKFQFIAYYDSTGTVVLARRKHGSKKWEVKPTSFKGNIRDAHNVISIMVDGKGYLHMSWDHHNNPLRYARSVKPESLEMGEMQPMTGSLEKVVSYPEFYRFPNGDLLFAYRDGGSGNGNLVLNRYSVKSQTWTQLQRNLIDGEGKRNAYWQMTLDGKGTLHISWVWRESPDVASNHDMCYARSHDGGTTWENSKGEPYRLPITEATAEVVHAIPQNSNLINQTSMVADANGRPYIATYYKAAGDAATQFHLIYQTDAGWKHSTMSQRKTDFSLSGVGSRSIPISRPVLLIKDHKEKPSELLLVFRDEEFDSFVCVAYATLGATMQWETVPIGPYSLDRWEPSYDTELWRTKQQLHLYYHKVGQGQGETSVQLPAQPVGVLEVSVQ